MNVVLPSRRTQFNGPFPSGSNPLYQIRLSARLLISKRLFILMHTKLIFTWKVLHLEQSESFWNLEMACFNKASWIINTVQIRHRSWLIHGSFAKVWNATFEPNSSFCSAHASQLYTILVIRRPRIPTRSRERWLYALTCKRFIIELW